MFIILCIVMIETRTFLRWVHTDLLWRHFQVDLNTTLYYKILEHTYSILTLWDPDDMCQHDVGTDIYVPHKMLDPSTGLLLL